MSRKLFTVREVADQFDVTTGRIRQICREHSLGEHIGVQRVLTPKDVKKIAALPGWKIQKNSTNRG